MSEDSPLNGFDSLEIFGLRSGQGPRFAIVKTHGFGSVVGFGREGYHGMVHHSVMTGGG